MRRLFSSLLRVYCLSRCRRWPGKARRPDALALVRRYKNDREISAMTALVDAYQRRSVHEAEKILRSASRSRSSLSSSPSR